MGNVNSRAHFDRLTNPYANDFFKDFRVNYENRINSAIEKSPTAKIAPSPSDVAQVYKICDTQSRESSLITITIDYSFEDPLALDALLETCAENTFISGLHIENQSLSTAHLAIIVELLTHVESLAELRISRVKFAKPIAFFTEYFVMAMRIRKVAGWGMKKLSLSSLGLDENFVTEFLPVIPDEISLIDLSKNKLSAGAMISLMKELSSHHSLESVILSGNPGVFEDIEAISRIAAQLHQCSDMAIFDPALVPESKKKRLKGSRLDAMVSYQDRVNVAMHRNGFIRGYLNDIIQAVTQSSLQSATGMAELDNASADVSTINAFQSQPIVGEITSTDTQTLSKLATNNHTSGKDGDAGQADLPKGFLCCRKSAVAPSKIQSDNKPGKYLAERLTVAFAETIGRRPTMEDVVIIKRNFRGRPMEALFGVFDGHGGRECAEFIAATLPAQIERQLNRISELNRLEGFTRKKASAIRDGTSPAASETGGTQNNNSGSQMASPTGPEFVENSQNSITDADLSSKLPVESIMRAIALAYENTDRALTAEQIEDGTTSVICYLVGNTLFTANCGDSRAVLINGSKAVRLSTDHKPDNPSEQSRITRLGGFVEDGRILGALAVARSFGDSFLKPYVTYEPTISHRILTPAASYLIVACDGLFDVIYDQVLPNIVSGEPSERAASQLRDRAYLLGSTDNISVIAVKFK